MLHSTIKLSKSESYLSIPVVLTEPLQFSWDVLASVGSGAWESSRAGDRCPWVAAYWTPAQLRQAWKPPCVFAVVKAFCARSRGISIACADSPTVGSDMLAGNSLCPINFHFLSSFTL